MARGGFQTYYKSGEKVCRAIARNRVAYPLLGAIMTISLFFRASTRNDLEKCCAATMEEWRIVV
jgi:hypothetical protein